MKKYTLEQMIQGLVDSENNCIYNGVKSTVVSKKWVKELQKYREGLIEARQIQGKAELLKAEREVIADEEFAKASYKILDIPKESHVEESDRWETDGDDKWLKKFYYTNPDGSNDSLVGTFIVDFKPNSATVADVHSNT